MRSWCIGKIHSEIGYRFPPRVDLRDTIRVTREHLEVLNRESLRRLACWTHRTDGNFSPLALGLSALYCRRLLNGAASLPLGIAEHGKRDCVSGLTVMGRRSRFVFGSHNQLCSPAVADVTQLAEP